MNYRIFRRKLLSKPCENQGYIIDGYPKTLQQAVQLFPGLRDDDLSNEYEEKDIYEEYNDNFSKNDEIVKENDSREDVTKTLPDFVISLEATDEFLIERVIVLPQRVVDNTHYTEENMLRRLQEYRLKNIY